VPAELIALKCLETAVAVGFGCCGLARKETDLGTVSGAILAGTGLLGAWRQAQARSGLNSEALIQKLRKELAGQFAWESIGEQEAADFADADLMIRNNLADCIPPMDELAGLITASEELYPRSGALLIVDRLAQRTGSALFSTDGLCRAFALAVTEAALRAAMADDHYSSELRTHMIAALGDALKQLSDKVERGFAEARAQHGQLLDSIPDLALRREIMALVGSQPDASALAIAADVERFARDYRMLLDELAGFKSRDNELQDRVQRAKAALDQGDLAAARHLFDMAVTIARERALAPVRDLAQVLDQQARAAMLASDWQAAAASWQQAIGLLGPLDVDSAESLAWDAASALRAIAERHGDPRAATAAIAHWEALVAKADARGETERAARLQNNLGVALATQGARSGGEAGLTLLARAVSAYEAALRVRTETDMPADWAATQNNLGNALATQGARSGGEAGLTLLARAVSAHEAALRVRTETDMPADWAMTCANLGFAREAAADLDARNARDWLERAAQDLGDALRVHTAEAMPYYHEHTAAALARVRAKIAALGA
jgi:hypothetical protein